MDTELPTPDELQRAIAANLDCEWLKVDGDGQHWKHIKTPDGLEGYVPSIYTVDAQP